MLSGWALCLLAGAAAVQVSLTLDVCDFAVVGQNVDARNRIPASSRPRPLARDATTVHAACYERYQHKSEPKKPERLSMSFLWEGGGEITALVVIHS